VEFEACTIPDCPHRGRHAHPVGARHEILLGILQRKIKAAEKAAAAVTKAMLDLVAERAK
jgi:hypothetical protein